MKTTTADVAVIGGGVIGCAIARELARRGREVVLIERDSPGRRATWAAAGMLSPFGEDAPAAFLDLADASLQRFAAFALELREESGIDVEYRTTGKMYVSLGDEDDRLRAFATGVHADRFEITMVDGVTARALEPALTADISLALLIGRDHRVNNRLLAQALLAAGTAAGVHFRTGAPAAAISKHHGAVTGVRLTSGEHIEAPRVVLSAGAWSGMVEGLPRALPIRPIKGQMFSVDGRGATDRNRELVLERVIFAASCYVIPREDGRLLVGATMEDVGFRKGPTPRGLTELMQSASRIIPALADMPLIETWAGFRPASADGLPILGEDPELKGFFYATGHYRNGILLAPVTAACIADLVTGAKPHVDVSTFSIARFG